MQISVGIEHKQRLVGSREAVYVGLEGECHGLLVPVVCGDVGCRRHRVISVFSHEAVCGAAACHGFCRFGVGKRARQVASRHLVPIKRVAFQIVHVHLQQILLCRNAVGGFHSQRYASSEVDAVGCRCVVGVGGVLHRCGSGDGDFAHRCA